MHDISTFFLQLGTPISIERNFENINMKKLAEHISCYKVNVSAKIIELKGMRFVFPLVYDICGNVRSGIKHERNSELSQPAGPRLDTVD